MNAEHNKLCVPVGLSAANSMHCSVVMCNVCEHMKDQPNHSTCTFQLTSSYENVQVLNDVNDNSP